MSCDLKEGQLLLSVVGQEDTEGGQLFMTVGSQHGTQCERIVVTEQKGQMDFVPWARCELLDGRTVLVNLATVESVEIDESGVTA